MNIKEIHIVSIKLFINSIKLDDIGPYKMNGKTVAYFGLIKNEICESWQVEEREVSLFIFSGLRFGSCQQEKFKLNEGI